MFFGTPNQFFNEEFIIQIENIFFGRVGIYWKVLFYISPKKRNYFFFVLVENRNLFEKQKNPKLYRKRTVLWDDEKKKKGLKVLRNKKSAFEKISAIKHWAKLGQKHLIYVFYMKVRTLQHEVCLIFAKSTVGRNWTIEFATFLLAFSWTETETGRKKSLLELLIYLAPKFS